MKLKREQIRYIELLSKKYDFNVLQTKVMFTNAYQAIFDLEFRDNFNRFLAEQILKLNKNQIDDFLSNKNNFIIYNKPSKKKN